jgi:hypothetical protein
LIGFNRRLNLRSVPWFSFAVVSVTHLALRFRRTAEAIRLPESTSFTGPENRLYLLAAYSVTAVLSLRRFQTLGG